MPVDHSLTYTDGRLKNWAHRARLGQILEIVARLNLPANADYFDLGCSNGYVTERVAKLIGARRAVGFDRSPQHVAEARRQHPACEFATLDLNAAVSRTVDRADLITCFETLEHVGALNVALENIGARLAPSGHALLTVPIEIGPIGLAKYAAKRLTGYTLKEIGASETAYLADLLRGRRISRHLPPRKGYGTHFGFDYRDLEDHLTRLGLTRRSWTSGTTRFILATRPPTSRAN